VKILVATTAGAGHLAGVAPFAQACVDVGHEVRVAAPASFAQSIQRAGFAHEALGDVEPAALGAVFGRLPTLPRHEANALVIQEVFGRLDTGAALPAMRSVCDRWKPDLVLREPAELSSYVVARELGIPHVQANIGLSSFDDLVLPLFEAPLQELGCDPTSLGAAPRWSTLPPTFDVPSRLAAEPVSHAREVAGRGTTPEPLPDWWDGRTDPLVYVTFGSVAAGMGLFPDFYSRVVEQLSRVAARVLLTLGEAGDPTALGPVPANVHIERWWPQREVMPHAALVVGHGGFGTTQAALVAGVPQVAIPLFSSDQFANAERLQAVGAGVALAGPNAAARSGGNPPQGPEAVDRLAEAVAGMLGNDQARLTSRALAEEVAALPTAAECVSATLDGLH
jgi:UDP:flavonoid glycosyltransferase YjiC (YdhE family)